MIVRRGALDRCSRTAAFVRRAARRLLAATLMIAFGARCAYATPFNPDTAELKRLELGEVLALAEPDPEGAAGRVEAAIKIPVPPQALWAVMTDCSRASTFIRGLESCRVLERGADGSWDIREHVVKAHWMVPRSRSVFRSSYVQPKSIRFSRHSGDLRALEGEWRLEPLDQGRATRLLYRARVDPGLPVPGAVVRSLIEGDLPRMLGALRSEAVIRHERH